jgi:hypothetical protein
MHSQADVAQRIVAAIECDLSDRRGMGWDDIDEETQDAIRDAWAGLIRRQLAEE